MMRGAIAIVTVLIGLIVFTPFTWASTYEAWIDGVYDAELQSDLVALSTSEIVINGVVLASSGRVDVVVAVLSPGDESLAHLTDPSTRSARAPPTRSALLLNSLLLSGIAEPVTATRRT